ncbi:MAG: uracil-DNA glycosylase [Candidatus Gracilibacteria bacterium]|nr:uracil-DNA glycosylase [Candidatus Gracilibacteria bacterium]
MNKLAKIENSWYEVLKEEFDKQYFLDINTKINDDIKAGITIYPKMENIFAAFDKTHFDDVKVVILGQDPYHGEGQAQGFCFSVTNGMKLPPSLQNIYKELNRSLGLEIPKSGDLSAWTIEGVFLLNAILTVQAGNPASHAKIGWEIFTDTVIKTISDNKQGVIFLLWGAFAQSKKSLIDTSKHYILETAHPSPFSAHRGFLGSNCFKLTNEILVKNGKIPINWQL